MINVILIGLTDVIEAGLLYYFNNSEIKYSVHCVIGMKQAMEYLSNHRVEICIFNPFPFGMKKHEDNCTIMKRIVSDFPKSKMIAYTQKGNINKVRKAFYFGASGFVIGDNGEFTMLEDAIADVFIGKKYITSNIKDLFIKPGKELQENSYYDELLKKINSMTLNKKMLLHEFMKGGTEMAISKRLGKNVRNISSQSSQLRQLLALNCSTAEMIAKVRITGWKFKG